MKHSDDASGRKRRIRILEILREKKEVSVTELAGEFGVSVMTIRRDLHHYEEQGILTMHYGGASLRESYTPFADFSRRAEVRNAEKRAIARRAAQEIRENDVLFLDASTTVLPVVDFLPDIKLTVVTNSLPALIRLTAKPGVRVISCPGVYRELYGGLMDLTTVDFLAQYHFQKVLLGTSACEPDFGVSCAEEIEAAIKRTLLDRTDHTYLLADSGKMNRHSFIRICEAAKPDRIFTNADLSQTLQNRYRECGAKLVLS